MPSVTASCLDLAILNEIARKLAIIESFGFTVVETRKVSRVVYLKYLGIYMLVLFMGGCASFGRDDDQWFGPDKGVHFVTSAAIGAAVAHESVQRGHTDCHSVLIGVGVTLTIGAAKESYDKHIKRTYYSVRDMVWNIVGSSVGGLLATDC